jgi:hypothetical protein
MFRAVVSSPELLDDLVGRIAMSGARREDVAKAADDYPLNARRGRDDPSEIARGLLSFIGGAMARRRVEVKPLAPDERKAMDLWLRLWSREHKGAIYPVANRDHDHIRKLLGRAKARARVLGLQQASDALEHYIAGYLRIDEKKLVAERYPLAMLESRLPAIGEYAPEKPKPARPDVEIAPPPPMAEMPENFFQKLDDVGRNGPIARRAVH